MSFATPVSILYERSNVHKKSQVDDNLQKPNIDYKNLVIKNDKREVKGIIFGLIFSMPIWFLIISFIIWVIQ